MKEIAKRAMNPSEKRSRQDISLGSETLNFLKGVSKEAKECCDFRSLVASLCAYQYRFSLPMELPFGMGKDFPEKLQTPRPLDLLRELNLLMDISQNTMNKSLDPLDVEKDGETLCVVVGSPNWNKCIEMKEPNVEKYGLKKKEKKINLCLLIFFFFFLMKDKPSITFFDWIADLFNIFVIEKSNPQARRLGGCWYYVASEVRFDQVEMEGGLPDDEMDIEEQDDIMAQVSIGLMPILGNIVDLKKTTQQQGEEGEEEEEEEEEEVIETKKSKGKEDMEVGDVDEYDEDADEDYDPDQDPDFMDDSAEDSTYEPSGSASGFSSNVNSEDESNSSSSSSDGPPDLVAAEVPITTPESEARAVEIRKNILQNVEKLHCYMPSPDHHMAWFKRSLSKMSPGSAEPEWYPWGLPPLQRMVDIIQALDQRDDPGDEQVTDYLREILTPFANMQQQAE